MAEKFFKYHGLGNDFVILDRRSGGQDVDADLVRRLCDRHRGVGADGILVLTAPAHGAARMIAHNADGSVPEMCGNGIRCAAKYLVDHQREKPEQIEIETDSGSIRCGLHYSGGSVDEVEVAMGPAKLVAPQLPSGKSGAPFLEQELPGFPGLKGSAVSLGNPHLVLFAQPLEGFEKLGPRLESHPLFPQKTNVEVVKQTGSGLALRVWERGVGLTEACGTGACAAAAAAVALGRTPSSEWLKVELPGGVLRVRVEPTLHAVLMRGPATFVFEGCI